MMEHTSNARPKLMTSSSATDEISWRELNDQIDQCCLDSSDYGSGGDGGKGGRHGDNDSDEDEFNCKMGVSTSFTQKPRAAGAAVDLDDWKPEGTSLRNSGRPSRRGSNDSSGRRNSTGSSGSAAGEVPPSMFESFRNLDDAMAQALKNSMNENYRGGGGGRQLHYSAGNGVNEWGQHHDNADAAAAATSATTTPTTSAANPNSLFESFRNLDAAMAQALQNSLSESHRSDATTLTDLSLSCSDRQFVGMGGIMNEVTAAGVGGMMMGDIQEEEEERQSFASSRSSGSRRKRHGGGGGSTGGMRLSGSDGNTVDETAAAQDESSSVQATQVLPSTTTFMEKQRTSDNNNNRNSTQNPKVQHVPAPAPNLSIASRLRADKRLQLERMNRTESFRMRMRGFGGGGSLRMLGGRGRNDVDSGVDGIGGSERRSRNGRRRNGLDKEDSLVLEAVVSPVCTSASSDQHQPQQHMSDANIDYSHSGVHGMDEMGLNIAEVKPKRRSRLRVVGLLSRSNAKSK